ncbi:oxamate carbamoyltransferase subunit AllG family protein [Pseudomonas sp. SDO528_S397]
MSEAQANAVAVQRILASEPVLVGSERASVALGLAEGHLGHAGPPFVSTDAIPPVVLNALAGATVHEGWAGDMAAARRLILDGQVQLHANHDLGTVSPMAGVVRPGQRLMRIENRAGSEVVHATLAESGRRALRFGCYDAAVAEQLDYLDEVIGPGILHALPGEGLALLPLISQGAALGDDTHQRNVGAMYAFVRQLPALASTVSQWLLGNPQHFLNYAMAAAKVSLDRASGVEGSSIVTAISRNGVHCGVRIAGAGARWFTHAVTQPQGYFFPPHRPSDGQADLGDSAIVEAYGLGGTLAHAAPELARQMLQDWPGAQATGQRMRHLFIDTHPLIAPALAGVAGAGLGLDARRVAAAGEPVRIHTGIAHRDGETGWIGIGVALAPVECFQKALEAL